MQRWLKLDPHLQGSIQVLTSLSELCMIGLFSLQLVDPSDLLTYIPSDVLGSSFLVLDMEYWIIFPPDEFSEVKLPDCL